jgi:quaternary ammonium compound-resistance protein SugE
MAWLILLFAGILEVAWAVGLKYADGFSSVRWSLFTLAALVGSLVLLAQALRHLPLGTAYAVWTGIGAVGTAILGMVLFDEPRSAARISCLALIIAGILGLRLASGE